MKAKIVLFLAAVAAFEMGAALLSQSADPHVRTLLSLSAVNGGASDTAALRFYESSRTFMRPLMLLSYALLFAALFAQPITTAIKSALKDR